MKNHYIIGDIGEEYESFLALVAKLPKDANLIFVGNLGLFPRKMITYIRENNHQLIRGGDEHTFVSLCQNIMERVLVDNDEGNLVMIERLILLSYGLIENIESLNLPINKDMKKIEVMENDIAWMENLPLYIELNNPHNPERPIVVSHSCLGEFWNEESRNSEDFARYILNNSQRPIIDSPILNIYGFSTVKNVSMGKRSVRVDTGCGSLEEDKKLSDYCVETREVFEV